MKNAHRVQSAPTMMNSSLSHGLGLDSCSKDTSALSYLQEGIVFDGILPTIAQDRDQQRENR
jgi:hypothetical protein